MPINLARRSISVRCVVVALITGMASASTVRAEGSESAAGGRLREGLQKCQADTKSQLAAANAKPPKPPGEEMAIAGLRVNVWRLAGGASSAAPLVIFSHGFHGGSTKSFLSQQTPEARQRHPDHQEIARCFRVAIEIEYVHADAAQVFRTAATANTL